MGARGGGGWRHARARVGFEFFWKFSGLGNHFEPTKQISSKFSEIFWAENTRKTKVFTHSPWPLACWAWENFLNISWVWGDFREFPEFPGIFRKSSGISRGFPEKSRDFSEFPEILPAFLGISRNFPGKCSISVIPEIFDSRPAGSRPSSRRKFSNKFRGFLKISWDQKWSHRIQMIPQWNFLEKIFTPTWTN